MDDEKKKYTVEGLNSLLNKASKGRAIIVVMMEKENGTIKNSVTQSGSEGYINSWAAVAAAFTLIECVISNAPAMRKILSEYIDKPFTGRDMVLKAVLEKALEREEERQKDRKEREK